LLAVAIFARFPGPPASGQWLAQLAGAATLLGIVLPISYGLNWLLDRIIPQRISRDGERQGMDLSELGAGAYPEFATVSNEFVQR
jgi:Amt family ammonium transporter